MRPIANTINPREPGGTLSILLFAVKRSSSPSSSTKMKYIVFVLSIAALALVAAADQDRRFYGDLRDFNLNGAISWYGYCPDETSLGKVNSVSLTNCDQQNCVLNAREQLRLVLVYEAGGDYNHLDYVVRLNGTAGRKYTLTQGTGVEEVKKGLEYSIGVNFALNASIPAGFYTLRLLRTTADSSVELCIEFDIQIVNDDVEDECNPEECKLEGYCLDYRKCVRGADDNVARWESHHCGTDLFWNPAGNPIHGGVCDYFVNLPADLQELYRTDESCIPPCAWWQEGSDSCSPNYSYRVPFNNKTLQGRELSLSCPSPPAGEEPLYWVQSSLSCDRCSNAVDSSGNPCNCGDATTTASLALFRKTL